MVLATSTAAVPTTVQRSPGGPGCWTGPWASHRREACRALTGRRTHSPCPTHPRAGVPHQQALTVHSGSMFPMSEWPHLTTSGEKVGADALGKSRRRIFLRQASRHTFFLSSLGCSRKASILQSQLEQHLLGEIIPDILRWG